MNALDDIELVAVGASAGGVDALIRLLGALPAGLRAAVAVVLHIPPNRPSQLAELLGRHCALPVREVEDKEPLQAGTVYIAAPDYHMLVEPERRFALSCDPPVLFSRPSIDVLFESAAQAYRHAILGVVLTGASADGAAGLKAIRACGGRAWVQDPAEAYSATMPQAAIAQAGADEILTLQQMADRLGGAGRT